MASQYEKLAATLVDIRKIRLAYLMFCLPRNTPMHPQGKTVNIMIHLLSDINDTSNISFSLFLSSIFLVMFSWGEASIDEIGIRVLECSVPVGLTYKCHATIIAISSIFYCFFSIQCTSFFDMPGDTSFVFLLWKGGWWSSSHWNFFSCLLWLWIKVIVLLHFTSRHLKIPFVCWSH